jgi:hypothetical protein
MFVCECVQVKFEQGLEMLSIFKSYASTTSILDDFQFYESRQRAMQEKRARQQAQQQREMQRQQVKNEKLLFCVVCIACSLTWIFLSLSNHLVDKEGLSYDEEVGSEATILYSKH